MEFIQDPPEKVIANIVSIKELLNRNIKIPDYQRPYMWDKKFVSHLFYDIKEAMESGNIPEYRLGSIILHKDEKTSSDYSIVDGQQRYITILLLLKCLNYKENFPNLILRSNKTQNNFIRTNYNHLQYLLSNFVKSDTEKNHCYMNYLLEKCTVIEIIVNKESLAFQMFDSQNSRGKHLKPHDLLKAYHLREMDSASIKFSDTEITNIVNKWEDIGEGKLAVLFGEYLFQIFNWIKRRRKDYFTTSDINVFKGIKSSSYFSFANYHRASKSFQLDQPIIAGEEFFKYIFYYEKMLEEAKLKLKNEFPNIPDNREGLRNAKYLLERITLLFYDRFGSEEINKNRSVLLKLFIWAYSPYISMDKPNWKTYYKFGIGDHSAITNNLPLFYIVPELQEPNEFLELPFTDIEDRKTRETNKNRENDKFIHELFDEFFNKEGL